jgi:hypothetical protein
MEAGGGEDRMKQGEGEATTVAASAEALAPAFAPDGSSANGGGPTPLGSVPTVAAQPPPLTELLHVRHVGNTGDGSRR